MKEELYKEDFFWNYTYQLVDLNTLDISFKVKKGFRSEQEARESQKKDREQYEKDIKKIKKMTNVRYTFTEFLDYWFDHIFITSQTTSTRGIVAFAIQSLILPNLKRDVLLINLTSDYLNNIITSCKKISNASAFTCKKTLRHILTDAQLYGYIQKDLKEGLIHVPETHKEITLLDYAQIKKMLMTAKEQPAYYFEILLALFCGLRQGEILDLQYSDFDKEAQTLTISSQYAREFQYSKDENGKIVSKSTMKSRPPKAGSDRVLKIPAFLFDELEKKKKYNDTVIKKARKRGVKRLSRTYISLSVFGPRKTSSSLTPALKKICQRAEIPIMRMHGLRHCYASIMLEMDVPIEQISKCMGHSSVFTTLNTYVGIVEARNKARDFLEDMCPTANSLTKQGGEQDD